MVNCSNSNRSNKDNHNNNRNKHKDGIINAAKVAARKSILMHLTRAKAVSGFR
jgi:hypothetical protein